MAASPFNNVAFAKLPEPTWNHKAVQVKIHVCQVARTLKGALCQKLVNGKPTLTASGMFRILIASALFVCR